MILTCPECSTKFKVNPQAIPATGRMVKCAKCGHKWHAMPEGTGEEEAFPDLDFDRTPPPAPPAPEAAEEPVSEPPMVDVPRFEEGPPPIAPADFKPRGQKPKKGRGLLLAWVVLLLIVVGGTASLYMFRERIVLLYPPAQKLYHAIGIDASIPGYGLEITTKSMPTIVKNEAGEDVIVAKGYISNPTDNSVTVPYIKGELRRANREIIHSWTFRPDVREILPGEEIEFTTQIQDPPLGGAEIEFVTQTEAEATGAMADHN